MKQLLIPVLALPFLAGCMETAEERPMDEVPQQTTLADGTRQYAFRNGCVVILEPTAAVLVREGAQCELHHRDIALLYASGD
ncbi:hypothetical protein [Falsirhodobacter halotolerans]|uniref:hypothetical protein n=1 Tax=Falsirhodobacter halotolerans TaxID=1146892 RepID=UPI001FD45430|nr:hypothetical protein [Falsirhodobacter halotolerans]MCJ8138374.1 hypothetical protein [Falsirhodobacter halotolerans]